ncbi:MAG TPA: toll/interleukin-1 receptor domain-containing protein, partial [Phototrophicaceae bacterium]|nr:toll/interleukin-1 receptor domain-containing protein [Phototrophicaceae bacterium]
MKLFISYSRDDKAWVYELWRALRDEGHHDTWIDRQIVPASDWWTSILENIETRECFVYVMSPKSVESIYCTAELDYALGLNKPILPLMLKSATYPDKLKEKRIQYETFTDESSMDRILFRFEKAIGHIREAVYQGKYQPTTATRPNVPQPEQAQPDQIEETIKLAESAISEGNFSLAERFFSQIMTKSASKGVEAAQRLIKAGYERARSNAYTYLVHLAEMPEALALAESSWQ